MKKLLSFLGAANLVVSTGATVVACGDSPNEDKQIHKFAIIPEQVSKGVMFKELDEVASKMGEKYGELYKFLREEYKESFDIIYSKDSTDEEINEAYKQLVEVEKFQEFMFMYPLMNAYYFKEMQFLIYSDKATEENYKTFTKHSPEFDSIKFFEDELIEENTNIAEYQPSESYKDLYKLIQAYWSQLLDWIKTNPFGTSNVNEWIKS
ncbi:hypothetical protein SCHIN_v1c10980 [Spiroplasma chinense]|uniref:Lipoprotein n=1 Tax=Spiroplasma chinense TaxID=216932 RepID=A0A5B9Y5H2_9MOLU|nr:lipoprotein [Spiroplasma chinense]QEH62291.1 hypothetical protein SCHIN_v1c10980 [Spiroplasma chinense]